MRDTTHRDAQPSTATTDSTATSTAAPAGAASSLPRGLLQRKLARRIQRRAAQATGGADTAGVHEAAARGMAGAGTSLPFGDAIQQSFGRHDVSGVRAHVGGAATQAADAMGATAYASGGAVAFREAPDLHTAAHEAAHVVQQAAGVQLKGGVGEAGDPWERHADQVADTVVAGRSAEALLDTVHPAGGAPAATGGAVQHIKGYKSIAGEMKEATWKDVAIEPMKFVQARAPKDVVEQAGKLVFVLHRGQARVGEKLEAIKFEGQDFPARYFRGKTALGDEIHVFGLHGEDWFRQMLYMLGVLDVPDAQVLDDVEHAQLQEKLGTKKDESQSETQDKEVTDKKDKTDEKKEEQQKPEDFDLPRLVAMDLGPTLEKGTFSTVTIGMKGRIRQAVERVLTQQIEPKLKAEEAQKVLESIQKLVDDRSDQAKVFKPEVAVGKIQEGAKNAKEEALSRFKWWKSLEERAKDLGEKGDPSKLIEELAKFDKNIGKKVKDLETLQSTIAITLQSIEEEAGRYDVKLDEKLGATEQLQALGESSLMKTRVGSDVRQSLSVLDAKHFAGELEQALSKSKDPLAVIEEIKKQAHLGQDPMVKKWVFGVDNLRVGAKDLPMKLVNCKASVIQHDILETPTGTHLLVNIADAHGDMAYHVTKAILDKQPKAILNVLGTAGSLDEKNLPPGTFVKPQGVMTSMEPGREPIEFKNSVEMKGAVEVKGHSNVSTLLREHDQGLQKMGERTMDMESYHVVRAIEEAEKKPELRILFRVSDVANSKEHGAQRQRGGNDLAELAQKLDEESAVIAMGLVNAPLK